jgi:diguanylate cyclase (GGDEF)-like protein
MAIEHTQVRRTNVFDKSIMVDLTRAVTEISSCLEEELLFKASAVHLMRLLNADGGFVAGWHPETGENLHIQSFKSPFYPKFDYQFDPATLLQSRRLALVVKESRILQVNISDSALGNAERRIFSDTGTKSMLLLPLMATDRFMGVIGLLHIQQPRLYDKQDILIGHLISSQASTSLSNAYLYQDSRQRTEELEAVRKAALSVTASLDLQQVLDAILKGTLELLSDVEDAHIFLYQKGKLVFGSARWGDGQKEGYWAEPRPNGLTYTVAREGNEIIVEDMQAHSLFSKENDDWTGAIIGLPLKIGKTVVGVMNVAYQKPRNFSASELRILKLLGDQAAIAIDKARLHQLIEQQAHTDALTGLPNRRDFMERLELEVLRSRRYRHPFALAMMDVNHFKSVNDRYGHPAGDLVLQQTAQYFMEFIRDTDFVARYGGDEFVFIFPETNLVSAQRLLAKLFENYEKLSLKLPGDKEIKLSAAFGIAVFPDMAESGKDLVQLADQEMYQHKRQLD